MTAGGGTTTDSIGRDVRFAVRLFRKSPGFAALAVATLAVGIGANAAIFSVVEATMLRLPFPRAERLFVVQNRYPGSDTSCSLPDFREWRSGTRGFDSLVAFFGGHATRTGAGDPERVRVDYFTRGYFRLLGTAPRFGRMAGEADHRPGAPPVCLVDAAWWNERFGEAERAPGRSITLGGIAYTVIGVIPAGAPGLESEPPSVWIPLEPRPPYDGHGNNYLTVIGRAAPGVSPDRAREDLSRIQHGIDARFPANAHDIATKPLSAFLLGSTKRVLLLLFLAVALVLLIACANVANLLLARGAGRTRELAVREALGAPRGRIVRQLLVEGFVLAAAAGAAAIFVAAVTVSLVVRFWPADLWRPAFGIDLRVGAFALAASAITALLAALPPALRVSRGGPAETLRDASPRASAGSRSAGLRSALVVSETALACVLLVVCMLTVRSLWKMLHEDLGFRPGRLLTAAIAPSRSASDDENRRFATRVVDEAGALPGVESVSVAASVPLGGDQSGDFRVEGRVAPRNEELFADENFVDDRFFRTAGIPLRRGRAFTPADAAGAPRVAVVNEAFARKIWPGADPIGRRIGVLLGPDQWQEVVGVAADVKGQALDAPPPLQIYLPLAQETPATMFLLVRYRNDDPNLLASLRSAVRRADPTRAVGEVRLMGDIASAAASRPRATAFLFTVFAGLAVVLTAVGVYGVLAFAVRSRTAEIGVRMALGATAGDIRRMVLASAARLAGAGLGAGLVVALAATRLMRSLLYGVGTADPAAYAAAAALLLASAALAASVPARRATRIDPMIALREQ
jgi:predicted permease